MPDKMICPWCTAIVAVDEYAKHLETCPSAPSQLKSALNPQPHTQAYRWEGTYRP